MPEQADAFCRNLTRSSSRLIVITAAKPGQEGVYHFNCQPKEYWIEKIQSLGFTYRKDLSEKISDGWKKNIPGIPELIRNSSYEKIKTSILYRGLCGIANNKIILNLPGSPGGVKDGLSSIIEILPHMFDLIDGKQGH